MNLNNQEVTEKRSTPGFNISNFIREETLGGFLLIVVTIIAITWANSGFNDLYHHLWHEIKLGFSAGGFEMKFSLQHWINDGLMAVFFFRVGAHRWPPTSPLHWASCRCSETK